MSSLVHWQDACGSYVGLSVFVCCQLTECSETEQRKGLVIPCMIYYMDNVTNSRCRELLERLEPLVFTNYQLIYKFADDCGDDIKRLHCGRTDDNEDGDKVHILLDFVFRLNFSFSLV